MELNNITLGNKQVVAVHIGTTKIYPRDKFTVNPDEIDVDHGTHTEQITVTSILAGNPTGVNMTFTVNEIGISGSGYVDGPNPGERIYTINIPGNTSHDDRHTEIKFQQFTTGLILYVQIWQDALL